MTVSQKWRLELNHFSYCNQCSRNKTSSINRRLHREDCLLGFRQTYELKKYNWAPCSSSQPPCMVYTALIALPTHMFWVRQEKTHLGGSAAKFEA